MVTHVGQQANMALCQKGRTGRGALKAMARRPWSWGFIGEKEPTVEWARGKVFQAEGTESEKVPCQGKHYVLLKRQPWPEGSFMCPVIFKFRIEVYAWHKILILSLGLSGLGKLYIFKVGEKCTFLNTQWGRKGWQQHLSVRNTGNLFSIYYFFKLCQLYSFLCTS